MVIEAFRKERDILNNKQACWHSFISEFAIDIRYTNGELNEAAEALSRINEIYVPGTFRF